MYTVSHMHDQLNVVEIRLKPMLFFITHPGGMGIALKLINQFTLES